MPEDDPNEWPLHECKVKEAWELPLPDHGEGKSRGEGIVIVHPDTGWTEHPELIKGGRYINSLPLSKNFFGKWSEFQEAEDDLSGKNPSHGTTTASLMLSEEGHPSTGSSAEFPHYNVPTSNFVSGIAPKVEVIPLRVTNLVLLGVAILENKPINTYATLAKALYYAAGLNTNFVGVISISLGGLGKPKHLEQALKITRQKGIIVIAAAGQLPEYKARHLTDLNISAYPAKSYHTISVAGCDKNLEAKMVDKEKRKFNVGFYGPFVELTAPAYGLKVARTKKISPKFIIDPNGNGTSYATAITAGACALWQSYHGRSWLIKKYGRPFLLDVFRYCLANSVDTPNGWDKLSRGNGVLDVKALLECNLPTVEMAEVVARSNQWKEEDWGDPSDWGRE